MYGTYIRSHHSSRVSNLQPVGQGVHPKLAFFLAQSIAIGRSDKAGMLLSFKEDEILRYRSLITGFMFKLKNQ